MKLKVKFLKLSAGRPVAILHRKLASRISIHVDDRVQLSKNSGKIIAVVDIASGMIKENEIAVSTEISHALNLKEGDSVSVNESSPPDSIPLIMRKMECKTLSETEIQKIVMDIVKNALTESEIAYFISSVYKCGMSFKETQNLIKAIVSTGSQLKLKGKIVDKHSCGGIPGRTTPIVVSICSSAGLIMPKTSSRAITSPSGTADALEVICKVDFSIPELKKIIHKTGACMVWGGSLNLAPADDKIIQVERLINLDPEPQLLASIMAKKIAVGSKYVLIEIPYGKYAKFNKNQAIHLKNKFEKIGSSFHIKLKCILPETREPLGNGIGPALEIRDVIKVLRRESPCHLLEARALLLSGALLELAGKAKKGAGLSMAKELLESGKAYKKFLEIITAQKGKLNHIPEAKYKLNILSRKNSRISEIDIRKMNSLARILGCPSDKFSGIYLWKHLHDKVSRGDKILTLYAESPSELEEAVKFYNKEKPIR